MKNNITKILLICICLMMVSNTVLATEFSTSVNYSQKIENPNLEMPMSGDRILIDGYAVIEAEDIVLDSESWIIEKDATASGGARIRLHDSLKEVTNHTLIESPELGTNIYVPFDGAYNVWIRAFPRKSWNRQIFMSVDGESYTGYLIRTYDDWYWISLGTKSFEAGLNQLLFKHRDPGYIADKIIVTADLDFTPVGMNDIPDPTGPIDIGSIYEKPEVVPPDSHPRLQLTKETIPQVRENIKHPYFAEAYTELLANAKREIDADLPATYSSVSNRSQDLEKRLTARAFLYALGEADASVAKEAIAGARKMMDTFKCTVGGSTIHEQIAPVIMNAAYVYDWCYDQMTEEDKEHLSKKLIRWLRQCNYPIMPDEYTGIDGRTNEQAYLTGPFAVAVAIYDEHPEPYLAYMGLWQTQFATARKFYNQSGRTAYSNHYIFRNMLDAYIARGVKLWGYDNFWGEDFAKIPYLFLEQRLPNGYLFKEGDDASYSYGKKYYYVDKSAFIPYAAGYLGDDPLITGEYARQIFANGGAYATSFDRLLFVDPNVETMMPGDGNLPLVRKYGYPMSGLVARTGWNMGMDSDTAMVYINMRNSAANTHTHLDVGAFQVYYKGALAIDSGNYMGNDTTWGSNYDYNYHKRTVAHNCVTVYDPDEVVDSYYNKLEPDSTLKNTNDGGQRFNYLGSTLSWEQAQEEMSVTKSTYTGPNEMTPKFAYIRGDLTNAYTSKISEYERAFIYMDLGNNDYPMALLVYDKVDTSKAEFPTKYLLHAQEQPELNEDTKTVTIRKTLNPGDNGKMVHKTLMPSNAKVELIGGPGKEYWVSDADGNIPTSLWDGNGEYALAGNWRAEVSYPTERKEHTFLNCMYVTDNERNLPELPMTYESQSGFVGVTIMDRTALLKNSTELQETAFNVTVRNNGHDKVSCFIADIAPGIWNVKGDNVDINVEVKEAENCIYFEGAPGNYAITPAENAVATKIDYPAREVSVPGDFYIYSDSLFWNTPYSSKIIDGVPYFDAETVFTKIGAEVTHYENGALGAALDGRTAVITPSLDTYELNGETKKMGHPAIAVDGRVYISNESCNDFMRAYMDWHPYEKVLEYISYDDQRVVSREYSIELSAIDRNTVIPQKEIIASDVNGASKATNANDFDLTTNWVSYQAGAWLMCDFGEIVDFSKIYVGITYGDRRVNYFALEISEDGKTWRRIFSGESKGGTLNPELIYEGAAKARYVRYVGNDNSEKTGMNCVSELIVVR